MKDQNNRKLIGLSLLNSLLSKNHPFPPFRHPSPGAKRNTRRV